MADGFAKLGHDVSLVCRQPYRRKMLPSDQLRSDFGLSPNLNIVQVRSSLFGKRLDEQVSFARQVARIAKKLRPEVTYSRSYVAPAVLADLGIPSVAESHAHPGHNSKPFRQMVHSAKHSLCFRALITIAPVLKKNFVELGVPDEKVHVLPDAVDLELFDRPPNYERKIRSRPRIVYAGHLYDYKGIPTILEAARLLPDADFLLIGGFVDDVRRVSAFIEANGLSNVELTGLLPLSAVPQYLWGSDVLLLPPSAKHPSALWTSPVKLGEYLASGTPIVATRIPALEYWLKNEEAVFVPPDSGGALAEGIRRLLSSTNIGTEMARRGRSLAETMSYQKRCQKIIDLAHVAPDVQRS